MAGRQTEALWQLDNMLHGGWLVGVPATPTSPCDPNVNQDSQVPLLWQNLLIRKCHLFDYKTEILFKIIHLTKQQE